MGSEVKFNIFSKLLTNENIILMSKILKCGTIFSPPKSPIIAHHHLCLDMFVGKGLISILKMCVKTF